MNISNAPPPVVESPTNGKRKHLSNDQRAEIIQALLQGSTNKVLKRGAINALAKQYDVNRAAIRRVWTRGLYSIVDGNTLMIASSKNVQCGRKKKDLQDQISTISEIPLNLRGTIRSTSAAMGISSTTLHARIKEGLIRTHKNSVKPFLTDKNIQSRLEFCLDHVQTDAMMFKEMMDVVHVDEKWFYMNQNRRRYYLGPDEEDPHRTTKSKRFGTKVMFLAAVARPRWDTGRKKRFDGKLGIWPFVVTEDAQRNSRNRPSGTPVTKPMTSVTNVEYRHFLLDKLLPAIKEKWPSNSLGTSITIQQDNARPHISPMDEDFCTAVKDLNLKVNLVCQPPNSPDMNVLDLGYFNAIQSLQHKAAPKDIDDLIKAVNDSFVQLHWSKLNDIFLTLQKVMEECILHDGNNDYKLPHISKRKLEKSGQLPMSIKVSDILQTKINKLKKP